MCMCCNNWYTTSTTRSTFLFVNPRTTITDTIPVGKRRRKGRTASLFLQVLSLFFLLSTIIILISSSIVSTTMQLHEAATASSISSTLTTTMTTTTTINSSNNLTTPDITLTVNNNNNNNIEKKEQEDVFVVSDKKYQDPEQFRHNMKIVLEDYEHDDEQQQQQQHLGNILRSLKELTKSPPFGSIKCPSPRFTPIYDKIVDPVALVITVGNTTSPTSTTEKNNVNINTNANKPKNKITTRIINRKIPPIIHVSFNNRCIPNELAESITRWQEALPDYSFFFHDDDAVQRLINNNEGRNNNDDNNHNYYNHDHNNNTTTENNDNRSSSSLSTTTAAAAKLQQLFSPSWQSSGYFPELQNRMRCIKFKGAMLIDVWRMLIIYEFGGLYTDIDNWPVLTNMNSSTIRPDDSFFSLSDSKNRPSQWLFAMTPKHPISIFTLQDISRRLLKIRNVARPRVVHITGPQTMKYGYRKFFTLLQQNATIFGNDTSYYNQIQKIDLAQSKHYAKGNLGGTMDEFVVVDDISSSTSSSFLNNNNNDSNVHAENVYYTNITKRQKIELVSGIHHWTEEVKLGQVKNVTYINSNGIGNNSSRKNDNDIPWYDGVSCMDYLTKVDNNNTNENSKSCFRLQ